MAFAGGVHCCRGSRAGAKEGPLLRWQSSAAFHRPNSWQLAATAAFGPGVFQGDGSPDGLLGGSPGGASAAWRMLFRPRMWGAFFGSFHVTCMWEAGPALMLQKARCEGNSLGGFVLGNSGLSRSGALYFRQEPAKNAEPSPLRIVVIASQDEFDETVYRDPEVDVSTAGNGRRGSTHALLKCLLEDSIRVQTGSVSLVALLILDFHAPTEGPTTLVPRTPLPREGPELMQVHVQGFGPIVAFRGAGELAADIAISTSVRRDMLTLLHGAVGAKVQVAMGHDYNQPYGPWGVREAWPALHEVHCRLMERTVLLATSRHLADFVRRWSAEKVDARVCYCADYGYFDRFLTSSSVGGGEYVTFISPCPAKGLCIFLRLAQDLPTVRFRAVTTVWTKTIHEQLLRSLRNVRVSAGRRNAESIYQKTAVLVVPSIWSEEMSL
ncbi:hypothetical protein AK812_SmicGene7964 [Symbiodinium microadriaticum]|uniref:Uncharacterized protein n=1 Tax=Symbiodinium microadriaticum TaxID=2951 RepID=A0A1Q9EM87_SYMMI|nr:hypothetical protein AK812_SmicGene7964 [Symbiodinium microadriaticum]